MTHYGNWWLLIPILLISIPYSVYRRRTNLCRMLSQRNLSRLFDRVVPFLNSYSTFFESNSNDLLFFRQNDGLSLLIVTIFPET